MVEVSSSYYWYGFPTQLKWPHVKINLPSPSPTPSPSPGPPALL